MDKGLEVMRVAEQKYPLQEVWVRLEEGRTLYSDEKISNAEHAVKIMQRELSRYDREVVCIVNLNAAFQPINFNMVSVGTLNASIVDVFNVLKTGILSNASTFIMMHNHPSGVAAPSREDLESTRRVILAAQLIGIPCLDHIIVAGNRKEIHSMREHNDLDFSPDYSQMMQDAPGMRRSSAVKEPGLAYPDTYSQAEQAYYPMPSEAAGREEPLDTPFGEIDRRAYEQATAQAEYRSGGGAREKKAEISLHFGKGLCQFFQSKRGEDLARIKIPNSPFESWPSFVVPAKIVHDNQYGKGYWMKLPAEGKTTLSVSRRITLEDGSSGWQEKRFPVDNMELKKMVESYKRSTPGREHPENRGGLTGQNHEENRTGFSRQERDRVR